MTHEVEQFLQMTTVTIKQSLFLCIPERALHGSTQCEYERIGAHLLSSNRIPLHHHPIQDLNLQ